MDVKDKIAIVTGASSGIGLATAKLLSQKGAKVALVARSGDILKDLENELPDSFAIVADMTKKEDIQRMVVETIKHFGGVDILVNNAGRGYDAGIEEIDPDMFIDIFKLDMLAPTLAMKAVIPVMRKRRGGAIVNISSGTARMALPNMSAYSSMKRALVGLSLTAREEVKDDNISVSVVYPYITMTNFEENTLKSESLENGHWEDRDIPGGDSPEYVAEKIVEAIITGKAEIFAHDWMGKR